MNQIPKKIKEELSEDSFMKVCCLRDGSCEGKIEFHHVIIFAGRQLQKKFAIVPACQAHHRKADDREYKDRFLFVALNRATDDELKKISKAIDYILERDRLNKKYL